MNDSVWAGFFAALGAAAFILVLLVGGKIEMSRIYKNCLASNGTLVYTDAVKHCKEIVK